MSRRVTKKRRQALFDNRFRVTDQALPRYNALSDPFLAGYFANGAIRKILIKNGVIRQGKKKYSRFLWHPVQRTQVSNKLSRSPIQCRNTSNNSLRRLKQKYAAKCLRLQEHRDNPELRQRKFRMHRSSHSCL